MSERNFTTKKLTILALFTTISLAIHMAESMLPPVVPIPGIKLGLANIITLIVLLNFSVRDAFLVSITRILLASIFAGSGITLLYSLFGAILSLIAMVFMNKFFHKKYIYITSIIGALFHNTGQILAAILLTSTPYIVSYLPVLMISGIVTGIFTGFCAFFANKHLPLITSQT